MQKSWDVFLGGNVQQPTIDLESSVGSRAVPIEGQYQTRVMITYTWEIFLQGTIEVPSNHQHMTIGSMENVLIQLPPQVLPISKKEPNRLRCVPGCLIRGV